MMDKDYIAALAASLEQGGADLDDTPINRARKAVDAAARANLVNWQPPPKADFATRIRQYEARAWRRYR